jgi:hypothetical protein
MLTQIAAATCGHSHLRLSGSPPAASHLHFKQIATCGNSHLRQKQIATCGNSHL